MNEILLTILIPSITTRTKRLGKLLRKLDAQAEDQPVELLCYIDNKVRSIGHKRNDLVRDAQGTFIAFVDDDDDVPDHYVATALEYIRMNPDADVFAIKQECYYNGEGPFYVEFGTEYANDEMHRSPDGRWADLRRYISHICIWSSELAKVVPFPDTSYAEDTEWAEEAAKHGQREVRIPEVMYVYEYDDLSPRR